ncbi:MAG: hypothetical protein CSB21_03510 [Deltaproteobacteria bacterium]|nr:MAG: hypothetical protein CSB21_03510 [Deltaproteobacteria bacterium]
MINQFIDEVISCGVDAIIPANLEKKWFDTILDASTEYLKTISSEKEINPETFLNHEKGLLLMAAVTELIQFRYDYPAHFQISSIPEDTLYDIVSSYSIAVLMEDARRTEKIKLPEINKENILEKDKIAEIEKSAPELTGFLFNKIKN